MSYEMHDARAQDIQRMAALLHLSPQDFLTVAMFIGCGVVHKALETTPVEEVHAMVLAALHDYRSHNYPSETPQ
jgi:hypothetical protein